MLLEAGLDAAVAGGFVVPAAGLGVVMQCAHVLEAVLAWHGNLEERPAAAEMAREAADRAARREQLAAQLRQREATERGPCRRAGRAGRSRACGGPSGA